MDEMSLENNKNSEQENRDMKSQQGKGKYLTVHRDFQNQEA